MRTDSYSNTSRYCVTCGRAIGSDRTKKAITCSIECSKERARWWRSMMDAVRCRYCLRPSSPEERARYARFKAWEKKNGEFVVPKKTKKEESKNAEVPDNVERG